MTFEGWAEGNSDIAWSTHKPALKMAFEAGRVEGREHCVKFSTDMEDVFIERRAQGWHYASDKGKVVDGKELWAISRRGFTLNKDGEWEYEPLPSSRDSEYLARTRWKSYELALASLPLSGQKGSEG